jgi:hypothetical protein
VVVAVVQELQEQTPLHTIVNMVEWEALELLGVVLPMEAVVALVVKTEGVALELLVVLGVEETLDQVVEIVAVMVQLIKVLEPVEAQSKAEEAVKAVLVL